MFIHTYTRKYKNSYLRTYADTKWPQAPWPSNTPNSDTEGWPARERQRAARLGGLFVMRLWEAS